MPYAPPSRCTDPECYALATNRGRCDDHQPIAWEGRAPAEERYGMSRGTMRSLKAKVMRRDNGCCYICGGEGAEELEHKIPVSQGGARQSLDNLGVAHRECHAAKSKEEAVRGARRRTRKTE
jgi:5-methylcytosine-specific restriction enzyme A